MRDGQLVYGVGMMQCLTWYFIPSLMIIVRIAITSEHANGLERLMAVQALAVSGLVMRLLGYSS